MTIEVNVKLNHQGDANLWETKQVEISDEEIVRICQKAYETELAKYNNEVNELDQVIKNMFAGW